MIVLRLSHAFLSVVVIRCHSDMGIRAFWAFPFPNPSDMDIPFSYYLSDLGLRLGLGLQRMLISLGFWEWGWPKRGDAYINVTSAL